MEGVAEEAELAAEIVEAPTTLGDRDERGLVDAIELVADDGVADLREVDADLVLPAGARAGLDQGDRPAAEGAGGEGADLGERGEAAVVAGSGADLDPDPRAERRAEGEVDDPRTDELAVDERPVDLGDRATEEGALEVAAAAAAPAEGDHPGGLTVEAVGELPAVIGAEAGAEEVGERVAVIAGRGVDGEPGGLVEDEEIGVLIEDAVVEDDGGLARGGALDDEALAEAEALRGPEEGLAGGGAADPAGVDDPLDAGPGETGDPAGDKAIEAQARPGRIDLEGDQDERVALRALIAIVVHRGAPAPRVWRIDGARVHGEAHRPLCYPPRLMSTKPPPSPPTEEGSPLPAIIAGVAILAVAAFMIFGSGPSTPTRATVSGRGDAAGSQSAAEAAKRAVDASAKVRGGVEARQVDEAQGPPGPPRRNPSIGPPLEGMTMLPNAPKRPETFASKEEEIAYYEQLLVREQAILDKRSEFVDRVHRIRDEAKTAEEREVAAGRTKIVEDNFDEQQKTVADLKKKLAGLKGG